MANGSDRLSLLNKVNADILQTYLFYIHIYVYITGAWYSASHKTSLIRVSRDRKRNPGYLDFKIASWLSKMRRKWRIVPLCDSMFPELYLSSEDKPMKNATYLLKFPCSQNHAHLPLSRNTGINCQRQWNAAASVPCIAVDSILLYWTPLYRLLAVSKIWNIPWRKPVNA